jgi:hypothetical protein
LNGGQGADPIFMRKALFFMTRFIANHTMRNFSNFYNEITYKLHGFSVEGRLLQKRKNILSLLPNRQRGRSTCPASRSSESIFMTAVAARSIAFVILNEVKNPLGQRQHSQGNPPWILRYAANELMPVAVRIRISEVGRTVPVSRIPLGSARMPRPTRATARNGSLVPSTQSASRFAQDLRMTSGSENGPSLGEGGSLGRPELGVGQHSFSTAC